MVLTQGLFDYKHSDDYKIFRRSDISYDGTTDEEFDADKKKKLGELTVWSESFFEIMTEGRFCLYN